jgi:hypothetical protein
MQNNIDRRQTLGRSTSMHPQIRIVNCWYVNVEMKKNVWINSKKYINQIRWSKNIQNITENNFNHADIATQISLGELTQLKHPTSL